MSAAIDALLAEIDAETALFEPQLEGLRDFARLNLKEATKTVVLERIAIYERRLAKLKAAEDAIKVLDADGHPGIPDVTVENDVFADLADNVSTIRAAFGGFDAPGAAVSGFVTFGAPTPA